MKINSDLGVNKFQVSQLQKKQKNEFKEMVKNKINNRSQEKDELKQVSEEFESLFVQRMFKEMRNAGFKSKLLDGGLGRDIYEDMYYKELAKMTAKKTKLGIAEGVYRQLKQK